MKKVIVKTGKEAKNLQEIREYLHSLYPEAGDSLSWMITYSEGEEEGGYGISKGGEYLEYFSEREMRILRGEGYTVLERKEIGYSSMLKKILE